MSRAKIKVRSKSQLRRVSTQVLALQNDKEDKEAKNIRELISHGDMILTGESGEEVRKKLLRYAKKHARPIKANYYVCWQPGCNGKKVWKRRVAQASGLGAASAAESYAQDYLETHDAEEVDCGITVCVQCPDGNIRMFDVDAIREINYVAMEIKNA